MEEEKNVIKEEISDGQTAVQKEEQIEEQTENTEISEEERLQQMRKDIQEKSERQRQKMQKAQQSGGKKCRISGIVVAVCGVFWLLAGLAVNDAKNICIGAAFVAVGYYYYNYGKKYDKKKNHS